MSPRDPERLVNGLRRLRSNYELVELTWTGGGKLIVFVGENWGTNRRPIPVGGAIGNSFHEQLSVLCDAIEKHLVARGAGAA